MIEARVHRIHSGSKVEQVKLIERLDAVAMQLWFIKASLDLHQHTETPVEEVEGLMHLISHAANTVREVANEMDSAEYGMAKAQDQGVVATTTEQ